MCGCFNQPFFPESRINAEKSNCLSYAAGQSNWVSCVRQLFLTLYPNVSVDMRLRHHQYSKEASREPFHMDRRWMGKERLFWAKTNINCAPWWPWETLFLGKRPSAVSATEIPKLLSNWAPAKGKYGSGYEDVLTAFCFQLLNSSKKHVP